MRDEAPDTFKEDVATLSTAKGITPLDNRLIDMLYILYIEIIIKDYFNGK